MSDTQDTSKEDQGVNTAPSDQSTNVTGGQAMQGGDQSASAAQENQQQLDANPYAQPQANSASYEAKVPTQGQLSQAPYGSTEPNQGQPNFAANASMQNPIGSRPFNQSAGQQNNPSFAAGNQAMQWQGQSNGFGPYGSGFPNQNQPLSAGRHEVFCSFNMTTEDAPMQEETDISNLPLVANSGPYSLTITQARIVETTRSNQTFPAIWIRGKASHMLQQHMGQISLSISIPNDNFPVSMYDRIGFDAFCKVTNLIRSYVDNTGNMQIAPYICTVDEMDNSGNTVQSLPSLIGQELIIVVKFAYSNRTTGRPYFNIKDAFYANQQSFFERSINSEPKRILNYVNPSNRYFLPFEGNQLCNPVKPQTGANNQGGQRVGFGQRQGRPFSDCGHNTLRQNQCSPTASNSGGNYSSTGNSRQYQAAANLSSAEQINY